MFCRPHVIVPKHTSVTTRSDEPNLFFFKSVRVRTCCPTDMRNFFCERMPCCTFLTHVNGTAFTNAAMIAWMLLLRM